MYDEVLLGELHMPLKTLCFMLWEGSNVQVSISLLHLSLSLLLLKSELIFGANKEVEGKRNLKEGGQEKKLTIWSELLTFFSLAYFALWSGG